MKFFLYLVIFYSCYTCYSQSKTPSDILEEKEKLSEENVKQRNEFQAKLRSKDRSIKELQTKITILEDSLGNIVFDSKNSTRLLTNKQLQVDSLRLLISSLDDQKSNLLLAQDTLSNTIHLLNTKLDSLLLNNSKLTASQKKKAGEEIAIKIGREISKAREDLDELIEKQDSVQSELKNSRTKLISLKENLTSVEEDVNQKKEKQGALESSLTSLKAQIAKKSASVIELEKENESLLEQKQNLQRDIHRLDFERSQKRTPLFNLGVGLHINKLFDNSFESYNNQVYIGADAQFGWYLDKKMNDKSTMLFLSATLSFMDSLLVKSNGNAPRNNILTTFEAGVQFREWFYVSAGSVILLNSASSRSKSGPMASIGFNIPITSTLRIPLRTSMQILDQFSEPYFGFETGVSVTFDFWYL
jgi:DNA repair exonuclease SbcCD ATPase subunit